MPGSGKTTLARELKKQGFVHISSDNMGPKGWMLHLKKAIENNEKFILVDRCNSSRKQREKSLNTIDPYREKISAYLVTLNPATYEDLKERILNDTGHKYKKGDRIKALGSHLKEIDQVDILEENWDGHIEIKQKGPSEILKDMKDYIAKMIAINKKE